MMRLFSLILVTVFCIILSGCDLVSDHPDKLETDVTITTTSAESETEKEDPELKRFRNMTQEEIEKDIFDDAEKLYAMFDLTTLYCDENKQITIGDMIYNAVQSHQPDLDSGVDFSSYENFKNYTRTIFSDEFTDKLFKDNERYINLNGKLYAIIADRGSDISYHSRTFAVTKAEEDKVEYTIYAKYIKDEYFEDYFDGKWNETTVPAYALETREYVYPREKINDKWVFTDFCSVY